MPSRHVHLYVVYRCSCVQCIMLSVVLWLCHCWVDVTDKDLWAARIPNSIRDVWCNADNLVCLCYVRFLENNRLEFLSALET